MTHEETEIFINKQNESLAAKGTILLTVKLETAEQAAEIIRWMYSKTDKPMTSELIEIAWDKVAVRKEDAEALVAFTKAVRL
jgi:hypothetical protein